MSHNATTSTQLTRRGHLTERTPLGLAVAVAVLMVTGGCAGPFSPAMTPPIPQRTQQSAPPTAPGPFTSGRAPSSPQQEQAVSLAKAVGRNSPDRLAGWLAVYDALGIPVLASKG